MKQVYFFLTVIFAVSSLQGQENYIDFVQIGDKITIGEPSGSSYVHIDVPRKNFIIKRGGIVNIASLNNTMVTITDIFYGEKPKVTFKKSNGQKFFRVYKTMTADLNNAVGTGELRLRKSGGQGAIVK